MSTSGSDSAAHGESNPWQAQALTMYSFIKLLRVCFATGNFYCLFMSLSIFMQYIFLIGFTHCKLFSNEMILFFVILHCNDKNWILF